MLTDTDYMAMALEQARLAGQAGDVPVGAVIVHKGRVLAQAGNRREADASALAHAELLVIDQACRALGSWRLEGCTLYVTLEPCPMCAGAIINARVSRLVFGADDLRFGCAGSLANLFDMPFNHRPKITRGIMAAESRNLLQQFFNTRR